MRAAIVLLGVLAACGRIGFDEMGTRPDADNGDTAIEVDGFSTSSPTFTPIPDATLTIPPSASRWLLVTTATLQSDSLSRDGSAELRYVLDGVEIGMGGAQNNELDRPGPFQHFAIIDGKPTPQIVSFELHDLEGGTARVEQLRAYAVVAPPAIYETADPIAAVTATAFTPTATFNVPPGDYLFFGLANASELPGSSDCYTRWVAASGAIPALDMQNPRGAWQSRVVIWRETIAAPASIAFEAHVSGATGGVRNVRLLGYRVGDLTFDIASKPEAVLTTTTSSVLELVPTITAARYLFVASTRISEDCGATPDIPVGREVTFTGSTSSTISHAQDNCAFEASYGRVELTATRPSKLKMSIGSSDGRGVAANDSTLILLGL